MSSEEPTFESEAEYPDIEHLWEFAGQGLRSADFNSAMAHFYRAEVNRSNTWRQRLDVTTNWAVITTAAALTFAFGAPNNTHLASATHGDELLCGFALAPLPAGQ
jgi:uncharacterized membrane protein